MVQVITEVIMEVVIMTDITVDTTVDIIEGIDMRTRGVQSIKSKFGMLSFIIGTKFTIAMHWV